MTRWFTKAPGRHYSWQDVPEPRRREPEDAIVRVDAVTRCGTEQTDEPRRLE